MPGTVTFAYDNGADYSGYGRGVTKVVVSWTCDASGDAAGTSGKIVGELVKGVTNPTDSPTDNHDIVITDEDGFNVLASCDDDLQDRDVTNSEEVYFLLKDASTAAQPLHPVVCSKLTITVAAAGNVKSGVLSLYVRV